MSTLKRYAVALAIGAAIGGALAGIASVPHLSAVKAVSLWAIVVALGPAFVVNWTSHGLYRLRGGWKVQLAYAIRADVGWEALTDADVDSEWTRLGSPAPACVPEAGWHHRRTNSVLVWFTDAQGERCEVLANPANPRVIWALGFTIASGRRALRVCRDPPASCCWRASHILSFRSPMMRCDKSAPIWVAMSLGLRCAGHVTCATATSSSNVKIHGETSSI